MVETISHDADIFLYHISTETEIAVTTGAGYQGPPSIYGTEVVLFDFTDNKIYIATITGDSTAIHIRKQAYRTSGPVPNKYYNLHGRLISLHAGKKGRQAKQIIVEGRAVRPLRPHCSFSLTPTSFFVRDRDGQVR